MKNRIIVNSARGVFALYSLTVFVPLLTQGADIRGAKERVHSGLASIRGATKTSDGAFLPGTLIVVHALNGDGDRTSTTGPHGEFQIGDLKPGQYQVFASKKGFLSSPATVQLASLQTGRLDLSLQPLQTADESASVQAKADQQLLPTVLKEFEAMRKHIDELEMELHKVKAQTGAATDEISKPAQLASRPDTARLPLVASLGNPPLSSLPPPSTTGPFAPVGPSIPQAASTPQAAPAPPAVDLITPFADADWTWMNGNSRQHDSPLDGKYFSGEFRADVHYGIDTNQPIDHSMGGSSEVFRNSEVQVEDLSIGGDFHAGNVRGRVLALFGMFAATTVRNDASPAVGQWDVRAAYKYVSEAYGGYHFNVNHGLNVDAGIFVSYVGLFSYHNFDNWAYQPSYVSSNTPWFFNGVRVQWFPTHHLKIEPWFVNGWQAYNKFNGHPGVGGQIKWSPKPWLTIIGNQYAVGNDNIGLKHRGRYHTDDSIEVKYYDHPKLGNGIDRMAFTFTGDLGCETGDGVTCHGGKGGPKQAFLGYMAYNRFWWHKDLYALTLGGGQISNPGRYLTLVLPVNGADAITGTPYFPAAPGTTFKAYDATATFDYMPSQFFTFRTEFGYRHSNVPYWSGRGGITPPGGNNGSPANFVCSSGASSGQTDLGAAELACGGGRGSVWFPDLRKGQGLLMFSFLVKF